MQNSIFISYRRQDSGYVAHMIRDSIVASIPTSRVFMDVDNIPLGTDFRVHIDANVKNCNVLLAIIGPEWYGSMGSEGKRRIDASDDFVRLEIESALAREIPVIPILIGTARMPTTADLPMSLTPLAYRQAAEIRHGPHLGLQMQTLMNGLKESLSGTGERVSGPTSDLYIQHAPKLDSKIRSFYISRKVIELRNDILRNKQTPFIAIKISNSEYPDVSRFINEKGEIVLNTSPEALGKFSIDENGLSLAAKFAGKSLTISVPTDRISAIWSQQTGQGESFESL